MKIAWYIYLNFIDLAQKSTFCLLKTEFKAIKLFARNQGSQLSTLEFLITVYLGGRFSQKLISM